DWLADALHGERHPEHRVDERALPGSGLPADEDVRVAELLHCPLLLGAEERGRGGRHVFDVVTGRVATARGFLPGAASTVAHLLQPAADRVADVLDPSFRDSASAL